MIFKRSDGYKIEVDPFMRFIPLIMKDRNDAFVLLSDEIEVSAMDKYIKSVYEETGNRLSYMHLIYAAMVRTLYERPKLNQFIMNGKYYMRNDILISMVVKKEMSLEGEETALKFKFNGLETPTDIKDIINKRIEVEKDKNTEGNNATDKLVGSLRFVPTSVLKLLAGIIKLMDKWNMIPASLLEASPFHASSFITNLGSIGLDAAYHHIYNFGTIGSFISIGKKNKKIIKKKGEFIEEKFITISFVADERICDGYYWASAMKTFFKYLNDPKKLELK